MTRDDVRKQFDEIVDPQVNQVVSEKLSELMDLSAKGGPRPEATEPKLVAKLWR